MKYSILVDGERLYHSAEPSQGMKILSGNVQRGVNTTGSLRFEMTEENHCYDNIQIMKSEIMVLRWTSADNKTECLFYGRPVSITLDTYNNKTVVCEGMAGTLNDSVVESFSMTGTKQAILNAIASKHNAAFGGNISIVLKDEDAKSYTFATSSRESAFDVLQEFCSSFNLSYLPVYTESGGVEIDIYDLSVYERTIDQTPITYGKNFIDIETEVDGSEMFSEIYPIGANGLRLDSSTAYVYNWIKRENYRLKDSVAAEALGHPICKIVSFENATTKAELQNLALAYLIAFSTDQTKTTIHAYDTGDFDGVPCFTLMRKIPFFSEKHSAHTRDKYFIVTKLTADLCDPSNDTIEVGRQSRTLTSMI